MNDSMSQSYHEVMEVYKQPISIRYIPRIVGWGSILTFAVGLYQAA
jgi:hypothetical protein|tara:strand:+ start:1379 stop:1516 length:138 start_codon:yes stop_codon:yes gene_type:complete